MWDLIEVVPNKDGPSQNFYWTATGPPALNARLRVTAVGNEQASDINDADIRIAPAMVEFILPHRKNVLRFGTEFRLFWKHNLGARAPVAIDVSTNGGVSWRPEVARTETKGSDTFFVRVDGRCTANQPRTLAHSRPGWERRKRHVGGVHGERTQLIAVGEHRLGGLTERDTMEPAMLYESPFIDRRPRGPGGLFSAEQVDLLIGVLKEAA